MADVTVHLKRIYDEASEDDGFRVLVDRLWPRGVSRENAQLDLWAKEVAPSHELRSWWNHAPELFDEFTRRYREELRENPALAELREALSAQPVVTLLFAAKDMEHNQAVVLGEALCEGGGFA